MSQPGGGPGAVVPPAASGRTLIWLTNSRPGAGDAVDLAALRKPRIVAQLIVAPPKAGFSRPLRSTRSRSTTGPRPEAGRAITTTRCFQRGSPPEKDLMTSARIVAGVDGSPASLDALRWAANQARLTGSSLEAVISWQSPTQYGNEFYIENTDWRELAQTTIDTAVKAAETTGTFACTRTVTEGHAAQVLVSASLGADLLVMGSRGHGGFAGMLLGSVSEYVIAHAACPVLVIRHPDQPPTSA